MSWFQKCAFKCNLYRYVEANDNQIYALDVRGDGASFSTAGQGVLTPGSDWFHGPYRLSPVECVLNVIAK
jgi:hypothetical protein